MITIKITKLLNNKEQESPFITQWIDPFSIVVSN